MSDKRITNKEYEGREAIYVLREVAVKLHQKTGVRILSVNFDWSNGPGRISIERVTVVDDRGSKIEVVGGRCNGHSVTWDEGATASERLWLKADSSEDAELYLLHDLLNPDTGECHTYYLRAGCFTHEPLRFERLLPTGKWWECNAQGTY